MAMTCAWRLLAAYALILVVLGMSLGASGVVAQAESTPRFVVRSVDLEVPSHDGVVLSARLTYRSYVGSDAATVSARETPVPAVLATHGWAESKDDVDPVAARIADGLGFPVLVYDSRGFGDSGGVVGLNGPDEQRDVSWLVDRLAASDAWADWPEDAAPVRLDGPDDPRVGMVGRSYAGAVQLLAAAGDPRIDAVVPQITWNDLAESLAPGSVVKRGWVDLLFFGGTATATSGGDGAEGGLDPRLARWYAEVQRDGRLPEDAVTAFAVRSPALTLDRVTADVLLVQGWRDTLFSPREAVASYEALAGREDAVTRLVFHDGGHGHVLPQAAQREVDTAVDGFLEGMLLAPDRAAARATAAEMPPVLFQKAAGQAFVPADAWLPGATVHETAGLPGTGTLADGSAFTGSVTLMQAAPPTSHTAAPETRAADDATGTDAPVPSSAHLATGLVGPRSFLGPVDLRLSVTPEVDDLTLFLSLVEVRVDGSERVLSDQVTAHRVEDAAGTAVTRDVRLVPVHSGLAVGSSLVVRVATGDSGYHGARDPGQVTLDLTETSMGVPWVDDTLVLWGPPGADPAQEASRESPGASMVATVLLLSALAMAVVSLRKTRR